MVGYPLDSLFEEVAFVAYHFHWDLDAILALTHGDRQRFIDEISTINRQMNETPSQSKGIPLQDLVFGTDYNA
ncbi:MAG: hypothetical protein HZB53_02495 [Chloroflexi bacterium]|nr:hypothetical protein [Chloroflexota bacterium]